MEEKQRVRIPREPPIQIGWFPLDYRLMWFLGMLVSLVLIVWVILPYDAVLAVLIIAAEVVLFGVFIAPTPLEKGQTSLMSMAFRKGSHWLLGRSGYHQHASKQPAEGQLIGASKSSTPAVIKQLGRVDFYPHTVSSETGAQMGLFHDRRVGVRGAVLLAQGSSLLSDDSSTRDRRLGAFAQLLDTFSDPGNRVDRFGWQMQTILGEEPDVDQLGASIRRGAGLTRRSSHLETLNEQIESIKDDSVVHRTTMSLTVHNRTAKRAKSKKGCVEDVLLQELANFYSAMTGGGDGTSPIGLRYAEFLSYNQLVFENRLRLDPVFAAPLLLHYPERIGNPDEAFAQEFAWPGNADFAHPDYCLVGQTYHRGFYFSELAKNGMPSDQLWKVLRVRVPKTVSFVVQMVSPKEANDRAKWVANSYISSNNDVTAAQRRVTASQRIAAERVLEHEEEVAQEVGRVGRLRCYIDVTGASLEELEANTAQILNAAGSALFTIESLTSRQYVAVETAMPLARGLSRLDAKTLLS